jgi:hypothetical protein
MERKKMAQTNPASRGIVGQQIGVLNPNPNADGKFLYNPATRDNSPYKAIGVQTMEYQSVQFLHFDRNHIRLLLWTGESVLPIWSPPCETTIIDDTRYQSVRRRLKHQTGGKEMGVAVVKTAPFRLRQYINVVNVVAGDYVNKRLCKSASGVNIKMEWEPNETIVFEIPILVEMPTPETADGDSDS